MTPFFIDLTKLDTSFNQHVNNHPSGGSGAVNPQDIEKAVNDYMVKNPVKVTETDPTVPQWAKEPTKPTYTASEVGALPSDTKIPTKLPNPNALTFTGAVTGTYDGSQPLTIDIPQGGGSADSCKMVHLQRYVHSSNVVLRPTHLDLATGIFTCNNHGLKTSDILIIGLEDCYHYLPYEILAEKYISYSNMKAEVVDSNTFKVRNSSGQPMTFPSPDNTHVDVTKFRIEKVNDVKEFKFSGFNEKSLYIRFSGEMTCGLDAFRLKIKFLDEKGKMIGYRHHATVKGMEPFNNNNNKGIANNIFSEIIMCNKICDIKTSYRYFEVSTANYNYSKQHPEFSVNRMKLMNINNFDSFKDYESISAVQFETAGDNILFANGLTIDIFALR